MVTLLLTLTFWISGLGLAYIYIGYPLAVWYLGRRRGNQIRNQCAEPAAISVVIAGYNEAARLPAKLDSILASDCADRIVEILVGSDGSEDNTAEVIESCPDPRVRLVHFPRRRGKPAVLNDLVPQCTGDVVVLTDARQPLEPDAISRLMHELTDPAVGVVSGELRFRESADDAAAARGMGAYWAYETLIRKSESRFRGVPGATGAFYAIRRWLFRPIPTDTLLDDVAIPMQAIERGYRCVLADGAIAWDWPSQSTGQESIRKRRTIAGAAQLVVNQPRWLFPAKNPIWWEFVSHKLLRLVSPVLLAIVLVTNLALASHPFYLGLLILQGAFYLAALVGWGAQARGRKIPALGPVLMFASLNLTTVAALYDAVRGRYHATWQRAA